jgi:hypothetical protein
MKPIFGDTQSINQRDSRQPKPFVLPPAKKELVYTPMTDREKYAAETLNKATFLPGCFDKRFARDIASIAKGNGEITDRQRATMWNLVYRYRRQISDKMLVDEAQKEIDKLKQEEQNVDV